MLNKTLFKIGSLLATAFVAGGLAFGQQSGAQKGSGSRLFRRLLQSHGGSSRYRTPGREQAPALLASETVIGRFCLTDSGLVW